jgi:catechol 2,3-dioxygenase-like lactoylglutathione lyase family enzyme
MIDRRDVLVWLGASAVPWARLSAQSAELPLKTTGLEHIGITVPDPEAAARFYGRIFDPQLFQERDPPPRFYVRVGTGYLAFGGNQTATPAIDHFCALVDNYRPQETRKALESAGVTMGAGALGMAADPDGLRLQMLGVPGGLARTIMPATRISQDDALVQAIGPDHILLKVSNLERSTAHYRKIFGPDVASTKRPARVWFNAARTRLGLEQASDGEKPSIHHLCVRVAGSKRDAVADRLKRAGVPLVESSEQDVLRVRDPNGLTIELLISRT